MVFEQLDIENLIIEKICKNCPHRQECHEQCDEFVELERESYGKR